MTVVVDIVVVEICVVGVLDWVDVSGVTTLAELVVVVVAAVFIPVATLESFLLLRLPATRPPTAAATTMTITTAHNIQNTRLDRPHILPRRCGSGCCCSDTGLSITSTAIFSDWGYRCGVTILSEADTKYFGLFSASTT